jgi:uncharacterized protein (UPF0248 family)
MPLEELDAAQCHLADPNLVAHFNALARLCRRIERERPRVFAEIQQPLDELAKARKLLERTHYQVGFIGRSQIGKSETFNNVLGINKRDLGEDKFRQMAPAAIGGGRAKTAAITRLRAADRNHVAVQYLSEAQHRERVDTLLKELRILDLKIDDSRLTVEENRKQILDRLEQKIAEEKNGKPTTEDAASRELVDKNDYAQLAQYLRAYAQNPTLIGTRIDDQSQRDGIPWDNRWKYINHDETNPENSSKLLLQAHVELGFETTHISSELEMIDLPGMDASLWDDCLTRQFLPELDAALVFNAVDSNVNDRLFQATMRRLNWHFDNDLTDRVWVIIFHIENSGVEKIHGDEIAETLFDHLATALRDTTVPLSQVLFLSNVWFTKHLQLGTRPLTAKIPVETFTDFPWKFPQRPDGKLLPPRSWERHPEFTHAFLKVTGDGGITGLRELMRVEIAQRVKKKVNADVQGRIQGACRGLLTLLKARQKRAGLSIKDQIAAANSAASLRRLGAHLRGNPAQTHANGASNGKGDFRTLQQADELLNKLRSTFDSICRKGDIVPKGKLHDVHAQVLGPLASLSHVGVKDKVISGLYEQVKQYLEQELTADRKALSAPVEIDGRWDDWTALAAVERFKVIDESSDEFEKWILEFRAGRLFSRSNGYLTFENVEEYRRHMHRRLENLVLDILHQILRRLADRVDHLQAAFEVLGRRIDGEADDSAEPGNAAEARAGGPAPDSGRRVFASSAAEQAWCAEIIAAVQGMLDAAPEDSRG